VAGSAVGVDRQREADRAHGVLRGGGGSAGAHRPDATNVAIAYALPTHIVLDVIADAGKGGGLGVWKSWLFWPFEIPRLGILTVASPLHELAMELHSGVYIAGEIMGAALLLWDVARARRPKASVATRKEGNHVKTLKTAPN